MDVRRQDGREWIRMDDTIIRRVRSEEVADGQSSEDAAALAAAFESHRRDSVGAKTGQATTNRGNAFDVMKERDGRSGSDDEAEDGEEWKEVNGANGVAASDNGDAAGSSSKGSASGNGVSVGGKKTALEKAGLRDSKVAYILFYQQIKK